MDTLRDIQDEVEDSLKQLMKDATEDFLDSSDKSIGELRKSLSGAFKDLSEALESGRSFNEIIDDMDTASTMQLSAMLSSAGASQAKAADALNDILKGITWMVLKTVIPALI